LLGLYGVWRCHDETVPFLPVGHDIFCELHQEASTELHSTMQNSHLHHVSENGLTVLPANTKTRTVRITSPADGVTLKFLLKVNWDVSIALKHAFNQVGSDAPTIRPQ
jgi:hypothetical protein